MGFTPLDNTRLYVLHSQIHKAVGTALSNTQGCRMMKTFLYMTLFLTMISMAYGRNPANMQFALCTGGDGQGPTMCGSIKCNKFPPVVTCPGACSSGEAIVEKREGKIQVNDYGQTHVACPDVNEPPVTENCVCE